MIGRMLLEPSKTWLTHFVSGWDQFWFAPRLPYVVCMLRIVTGLMLLYSQLVLATALTDFIGEYAWINNTLARQLHDGAFGTPDMARTYLWSIDNPLLIWMHHGITILITAAFAAGFMTRITAPTAWFLQLMYLHRLTGSLFGLDQIISYSAMYLMLTPCGSCFSVDAWLRKRLAERVEGDRKLRWLFPKIEPSVAANIGTRLLQFHLCVIYLFGGLSKARGELWWDGTAMWYAVANYEYQSWDMTWIGGYPRVFSALTHITLFWELFYCALVWPKLSRPIVIGIAIFVHVGIAFFLGMFTFGTMMIAANFVFWEPKWLWPSLRVEPETESTNEKTLSDVGLEEREKKLVEDKAKLKQRVETLKKRERKVRRAAKRLREKQGLDTQDFGKDDLNEESDLQS